MTNEEEFSARSQLKWTRQGDAWILLYRRRRMGRVVPDKNQDAGAFAAKKRRRQSTALIASDPSGRYLSHAETHCPFGRYGCAGPASRHSPDLATLALYSDGPGYAVGAFFRPDWSIGKRRYRQRVALIAAPRVVHFAQTYSTMRDKTLRLEVSISRRCCWWTEDRHP